MHSYLFRSIVIVFLRRLTAGIFLKSIPNSTLLSKSAMLKKHRSKFMYHRASATGDAVDTLLQALAGRRPPYTPIGNYAIT